MLASVGCGPAAAPDVSPPDSPPATPVLAATSPPATPSPWPTGSPSPRPEATAQELQLQLDPPQAEAGQPLEIRVSGLPPEVVAGAQVACLDLRDHNGQTVDGSLPLAPDKAGRARARFELSRHLAPGAYELAVVICGWTGTTASSQPPPTPPVLASVPYTVTAASGRFDQIRRYVSPDGQWTAIANQTSGSLELQRTAGDTLPIFPEGSTVGPVIWSPDSRQLLVVRTNWLPPRPDVGVQAAGPIEIWGVAVADNQVGQPTRLFQSPSAEANGPEQIVFGHWSPDGRYLTFWLGILSASILADGLPLSILDVDTGQVLETGEVVLVNPHYHSWAPDSSALAISAGGYRSAQVNKWLDIFDISRGHITTVISQTEQIPGIVAWSPRGDLIAYAAVPADATGNEWADWMAFENPAIAGRRVYLLEPASGHYRRLNQVEAYQDAPTWSDDGSTLYYVQRQEETVALMAADPLTGQAQLIEGTARLAPNAVGYYGQSDWDDLLAYRPGAPKAELPPLAETYSNAAEGYSLRYPAGWLIGEGWQSLNGWREMPTLTSYPPGSEPAPDLGPFSGQGRIAIEVVEIEADDTLETILNQALASAGPGQILDKKRQLKAFNQQALTVDGRPALRVETIGDFGGINHLQIVLAGSRALILRGEGDGRVFDAVAGSLEISKPTSGSGDAGNLASPHLYAHQKEVIEAQNRGWPV